MPTKRASQKSSSAGMGMGDLWKWVYVIGLIVAGLVGAFGSVLGGSATIVGYLLLLAAILSGIFYLDADDVVNYGIRVLLFFAVKAGFSVIPGAAESAGQLPVVGIYLAGFFTGVWSFLAPAALTLLIVHFVRKYFGNMM